MVGLTEERKQPYKKARKKENQKKKKKSKKYSLKIKGTNEVGGAKVEGKHLGKMGNF